LAFGSVYVGSSASLSLTISNDDASNTATLVGPTNAALSMAATSLTVPAATGGSSSEPGTLTVTLTFTPSAAGACTDVVTCTPTGGTAVTVKVTGTGVAGLTVSPASLPFGSVPVGSATSLTVSVTNSGSQAVALTAPAGYTLSPASVPAGATAATVTVTFAPTAAQTYAGAVDNANGVAALTLAGIGIAVASPDTLASTGSGAGAGSGLATGFESESAGASGQGLVTGTQATSTGQFFQIYLPNFGTATPPGASGAQPMTSFLRLGATPATSPETPQSTALLDVVRYSSPLAAGNPMFDAATAAAVNQTAISDQCQTLAGAVLSAIVSTPGYGGGTLVNPALASEVARMAYAAYTNNGNSVSSAQSAAVTAALGVFADDTRDQGASYNANAISPAQRVAESAMLLTKGGWRDHTDGNRVSTTYGDKVEVIRGNYKLVVLGRQDSPSNGLTWDSSGGMLQDNDAAPGQLTEIKWVETQGGTWRAVETCTKGDVETTFDGKVVERFLGGSVTSVTGSETQWTTLGTLGDTSQMQAEYHDAVAQGYVDGANVLFSDYLVQRGYANAQSSSTTNDPHLGSGKNPVLLEQTWADSISSYTGSQPCPVPTIYEEVWAGTITETTNAATITETTNATSAISSTTGSSGARVPTINESTYATTINETTDAQDINDTTTASGTITEKTTADTISGTTHAKSTSETAFIGNTISLDSTDATGASEIFLGPTKMSVAVAADVTEVVAAASQTDVFIGLMKQAVELCLSNTHMGVQDEHVFLMGSSWTGPKLQLAGAAIFVGGPPDPAGAGAAAGGAKAARAAEAAEDAADAAKSANAAEKAAGTAETTADTAEAAKTAADAEKATADAAKTAADAEKATKAAAKTAADAEKATKAAEQTAAQTAKDAADAEKDLAEAEHTLQPTAQTASRLATATQEAADAAHAADAADAAAEAANTAADAANTAADAANAAADTANTAADAANTAADTATTTATTTRATATTARTAARTARAAAGDAQTAAEAAKNATTATEAATQAATAAQKAEEAQAALTDAGKAARDAEEAAAEAAAKAAEKGQNVAAGVSVVGGAAGVTSGGVVAGKKGGS
jgi:hypothetical protein